MEKYKHYALLADLFRYPEDNFLQVLEQCKEVLQDEYSEALQALDMFANYIYTHTKDEREELFTKTFDVQPICYLDLGYVIFGEDYKRGAFLLHMQQEQEKVNNNCGSDLPDNLSNILTFFTKTTDESLIAELSVKILIPGVKKMIAEFEQARVDLKLKVLRKLHKAIIQEELNTGNVYRNVFVALLRVLEKDFGNIHFEEALEPAINMQHHKSFFAKDSINKEVNQKIEVNELVNNYKLD